MRGRLSQAILLAAFLPATAWAGGGLILQPVPIAGESVRFDRGDYLIRAAGPRATVDLRSAIGEGGDVAFVLIVRNTGSAPVNMDVSDVRVEGGGPGTHVLTRAELDHRAEHHAGWAKFWTNVGGSVVGALQMNQRNHYDIDTTDGRSSWRTTISAPCESCRADAYQTFAATGARVQDIQDGLDNKRAAYRTQALQMTTVDPGQVYASRIALSHFKPESMGTMRLIVSVGGDAFVFGFRFVPDSIPAPIYNVAAPVDATAAPVVGVSWASPPVIEQAAPPVVPPTQPAPVRVTPVAYSPMHPQVKGADGRIDGALRGKWSRYYSALIADGVPRSQAEAMTDQEVGPVE